jgi:quercetin dioxygenase-like cupin family protein
VSFRLLRFLFASTVICGGSSCDGDEPTSTRPPTDQAPVSGPSFTAGSGLTSTPPARGSLGDFKYKTMHDDFHFELKSQGNADVVTVSVTGGAGSHSGWHYHPGPAIVIVRRGTLTSYTVEQGECRRTEYPAGTALVEGTAHHIVVNEGTAEIELSVVFFTPAGAAQRIDTADPGIC